MKLRSNSQTQWKRIINSNLKDLKFGSLLTKKTYILDKEFYKVDMVNLFTNCGADEDGEDCNQALWTAQTNCYSLNKAAKIFSVSKKRRRIDV